MSLKRKIRGLRKREGHWHYRFKVNGREHSGNTGLTAISQHVNDALEIRSEARRKVVSGNWTKPGNIPFSKAAETFLEWCDGEYTAHPQSARRMRCSFTSLQAFFKEAPVRSLQDAAIEQYKQFRRSRHIKEITLRHDLHALSVFFQYARKQGWADENPLRGIRYGGTVAIPSDKDATRMYILSEEEEQRYFEAAQRRSQNLYDVLRIMRLQGCRPSEVKSLEQSSVNLQRHSFRIVKGKSTAAKRTLFMLPETWEIFSRLLQTPNRWVFPSARYPERHLERLDDVHTRVCKELDLWIVPYDMRHTFATRMALAGMPLPTLAAILGHGSLSSVMKYVHPRQQDLNDAMLLYGSPSTNRPLSQSGRVDESQAQTGSEFPPKALPARVSSVDWWPSDDRPKGL